MPYISLPEHLPGIVGLLNTYPSTGRALTALAETLLRGPSSLTPAERELIAAYVSRRNECRFCMNSHAAASRHLFGSSARALVDQVLEDPESAPVDERMKSLLRIAGKVQESGRSVLPEDVARAREAGADDQAIHDTVLTAAAFCMYNRYVDGLATVAPESADAYDEHGADLARHGYLGVIPERSEQA